MGFQTSMSIEDATAFRAMVLCGKPWSYIAAKFGMSPDAVRKRISRLNLDAPIERAFEPIYGPTSFVRTESDQCRYPLQDRSEKPSPTMVVCGKKTPPGHSWCPDCARLVFNKTALSRSPTLAAYREK